MSKTNKSFFPEEMPVGLSHVLLCAGSTSKDVFQSFYWQLQASVVGLGYTTFVFPECMRQLVRARGRFSKNLRKNPKFSL